MTTGIGESSTTQELATMRPWANPAPPIGNEERQARLDKARRLTAEAGAGALLIGAGASLRYFAGISWSASERLVAMLLPVKGKPIVIAPAFELGTLEAELNIEADLRLWEEDENPFVLVADAMRETGQSMLAIDPAMSFLFVERLRRVAPSLEIV